MIQLALVSLLAACGLYGWRERRMSPAVGFITPAIASVGIVLVLNPDLTNALARLGGIGRGADLIFYLWTALSALLIANIHFRLRYQRETMTDLAREIAILEARLVRQERA